MAGRRVSDDLSSNRRSERLEEEASSKCKSDFEDSEDSSSVKLTESPSLLFQRTSFSASESETGLPVSQNESSDENERPKRHETEKPKRLEN